MNKEIFDYLVEHDPDTIVLSELERVPEADRRQLVAALLRSTEIRQLPSYRMEQCYAKLHHKNLFDQLKPIIVDRNKNDFVRSEAIKIAQYCRLSELYPELSSVAVSQEESIELRKAAILAVGNLQAPTKKQDLMPIILELSGDDPDDELKGAAFEALFPDEITATELFSYITPHKNDSLMGRYVYFLEYVLFEHLRVNDLPIALNWVKAQDNLPSQSNGFMRRMESFCDSIMWQAWQNIQHTIVLDPFAEVALGRLHNYVPLIDGIHAKEFSESIAKNTELRQQFISALIRSAVHSTRNAADLGHAIARTVYPDDFNWLLSLLSGEKDKRKRTAIISAAYLTYKIDRMDHFNAIWIHKDDNADLNDQFAWLFRAIELNSPEASEMQVTYERSSRPFGNSEPLEPSPIQRVLSRLAQSESDHPQSWDDLTMQLTLRADASKGSHYGDLLQSDITAYPGWVSADAELRERIISAAERFLVDKRVNPEIDKSLHSIRLTNFLLSGYKALLLLKYAASERYKSLSSDVWQRWLGAIILFPVGSHSIEKDIKTELLRDAYRREPEQFIATILARLRFEAQEGQYSQVLYSIQGIIDEKIVDALLLESKNSELGEQILDTVFKTNSEKVRDWAWKKIIETKRGRKKDRLRIIAAAYLISNWTKWGWDKLWTLIVKEPDFGKAIFKELSNLAYYGGFLNDLSDESLASLYLWLWEQNPTLPPLPRQLVTVGVPDSIFEIRDQIPTLLSRRNTKTACAGLKTLVQRFPDFVGLRKMWNDSEERLRINNWTTYTPKMILEIANNKSCRLVASEAELQAVIMKPFQEVHLSLSHNLL